MKLQYRYPEMTELESRLTGSLLSSSTLDGEGIEDFIIEDPVEF